MDAESVLCTLTCLHEFNKTLLGKLKWTVSVSAFYIAQSIFHNIKMLLRRKPLGATEFLHQNVFIRSMHTHTHTKVRCKPLHRGPCMPMGSPKSWNRIWCHYWEYEEKSKLLSLLWEYLLRCPVMLSSQTTVKLTGTLAITHFSAFNIGLPLFS